MATSLNLYSKKLPENVKFSKTLSYLLRHGGTNAGVILDEQGWADTAALLIKPQLRTASVQIIKELVKNCPKQRFSLKEENGKLYIRANQGHSLQEVQMELEELNIDTVPCSIIHGTYKKFWPSIKVQGLHRCGRNHIHMAAGLPGSNGVLSGVRGNCDLHIYVDATAAMAGGLQFLRSSNNVILCTGNAEGFLLPKYFSKVIDIETGTNILSTE